MKKIVLLVLFISGLTALNAQREETLLGGHSRFSEIWGSWNSMMGKVADENVYFRGGSGGIEFGDLFLGWGGYRSAGSFNSDNNRFHMKWNGPVVSYAPHSYRAIHPIFTLMIANGKLDPDNSPYDRIFVVQPSLGAELNLLRWCHASVHGGYRFVNDVSIDQYSDNDFSGLYGELTLKFGISWGRW